MTKIKMTAIQSNFWISKSDDLSLSLTTESSLSRPPLDHRKLECVLVHTTRFSSSFTLDLIQHHAVYCPRSQEWATLQEQSKYG